jgi:hypothetical protein
VKKQNPRHLKESVAVITKRIDYDDSYYLIVPNIAAGSLGRYTVYRIPTSTARKVKIVGRELPLEYAKDYVKQLQKGERHVEGEST